MSIWKQIAAALDPVKLMEQAGFEPDEWQVDGLRSSARRLLLLCSRQSGKSTVAAALAVHTATTKSGALVLLLSPSQRQSGELFRKTTSVHGRAAPGVAVKQQSALRLELANGSRIVALPAGEETVRGFSGVDLRSSRVSPGTTRPGSRRRTRRAGPSSSRTTPRSWPPLSSSSAAIWSISAGNS